MRIDLVGTTADFRGFGPPPSLPINHLLCENPQTAGRIGEDGLVVRKGFISAVGFVMIRGRRYNDRRPLKPVAFSLGVDRDEADLLSGRSGFNAGSLRMHDS